MRDLRSLRGWLTAVCAGSVLDASPAVLGAIDHDALRRQVTLGDGQGQLTLRLAYDGRCVVDEVQVRGRRVTAEGGGAYTGLRVGERWYTTRAGLALPQVEVHANAVTVSGIRLGGDAGVGALETWRFEPRADRILWTIERHYRSAGTLEDTAFPAWEFESMTTWTGGLLGHGGVAWTKYLDTPNATYGGHTGPVLFWNRARRDALRLEPELPTGQHVAVKFTHRPDGRFACSHQVTATELATRHGLRRFLPDAPDLWAPVPVTPGTVQATWTLQAADYDRVCDRGTFRGLPGESIGELLNTIGRYGVVDRGLMGGNGWRTGWACLHEAWFAQMGLAINDPGYIANFSETLDRERDLAIRPDGRVLPRWHHDASDALPGTFDARTGYYECQWGYLLDSQPAYVICVAEQFDLTGDRAWLRGHKESCERALEFLLRRDTDGDGLVEMMTDSHTEAKGSDWIDIVWAAWENALVNAELYRALTLWAEREDLLDDGAQAARYRAAAARLQRRFNQTTAEGGFWNPARAWYVYWRDRDDSIHGDNLVVPVNFAAIAYGVCTDPARRAAVLDRIEAQMEQEGLFHWPLCLFSYAPGEAQAGQYPFPQYENGDLFLSWGELGVRAYAATRPELALKYVRRVLERYEADGLSFQRYLRTTQAGAGEDILAGNCMTIVGLYRNLYGVQPQWNRLLLDPHLTPDLDGTRLRYGLRGQGYTIELNTRECRLAANEFALAGEPPFALNVRGDTAEAFAGTHPTPALTVSRDTQAAVELRLESWPEDATRARRWSTSCAAVGAELRYALAGLASRGSYELRLDGQRVRGVAADLAGRLEFGHRVVAAEPQRWELVPSPPAASGP